MNQAQDELLDALRIAQSTFNRLSKDETIYLTIKEAWKRVSIALAKWEAL